jgi:hypothetical protein
LPATCLILFIAAGVSFLPQAALNQLHTGIWTGDPLDAERVKVDNPVWGLVGNGIVFLTGNLTPPVAPFAGRWNQASVHWMSLPFFTELAKHYRRFTNMGIGELPNEEGAGLGFGISILFAVVCFQCAVHRKSGAQCVDWLRSQGVWVGAAAIFGFLYLCAKLGAPCTARYAAVYYPLMILPFLFCQANRSLVRTQFWKALAVLCAASGLLVVVLTPSRPLWPWKTITRHLLERSPGNQLVQRAAKVYSVYSQRSDNLAALRKFIPDNTRLIGFMASKDDTEMSLWRPFGSRTVEGITSPEQIQASPGSSMIAIASTTGLNEVFGKPLDEILPQYHAQILGSEKIIAKISAGEEDWYVLRFTFYHLKTP